MTLKLLWFQSEAIVGCAEWANRHGDGETLGHVRLAMGRQVSDCKWHLVRGDATLRCHMGRPTATSDR